MHYVQLKFMYIYKLQASDDAGWRRHLSDNSIVFTFVHLVTDFITLLLQMRCASRANLFEKQSLADPLSNRRFPPCSKGRFISHAYCYEKDEDKLKSLFVILNDLSHPKVV